MNAFFGPYSKTQAGSNWSQGKNEHFQTWRQWIKASTIPRPSNYWVIIDEHPDSINDGYFLNDPGKALAVGGNWGDYAAAYHGGGCGISFADGHSELHKWKQPNLTVYYNWNPAPFNAAGLQDYRWLMERTAVPYTQ